MRKIHKIEGAKPSLPTKKRVAAYARISVEKAGTLNSLSAQVSYYSTFIQNNTAWKYAGVYADSGESGTGKKRMEFQRLVADCESGKIDIVLTKSISRFARNTVDLLETVRRLQELGVEVWFEEQNINTMSGDGELMMTILAAFAQEESRSISENVRWAARKGFQEGKPTKFSVYGYRRVNGEIVIDPSEAEVVKLVFDNFLSGIGTEETSRQINALGVLSRKGNQIHPATIRNMLKNVSYTGDQVLQKYYKENYKLKKNNGELPQYIVENHHPAIIDKETFARVQIELEKRRKLGLNFNNNNSEFTGKIFCAICGRAFSHSNRIGEGKVKIGVWRCAGYRKQYGCKMREIPEFELYRITAQALNLPDYDIDIFQSAVEKIVIPEQFKVDVYLQSGEIYSGTWKYKRKASV